MQIMSIYTNNTRRQTKCIYQSQKTTSLTELTKKRKWQDTKPHDQRFKCHSRGTSRHIVQNVSLYKQVQTSLLVASAKLKQSNTALPKQNLRTNNAWPCHKLIRASLERKYALAFFVKNKWSSCFGCGIGTRTRDVMRPHELKTRSGVSSVAMPAGRKTEASLCDGRTQTRPKPRRRAFSINFWRPGWSDGRRMLTREKISANQDDV